MIKVNKRGDFVRTDRLFKNAKKILTNERLSQYGDECLVALREATPKKSGKTASSWSYEVSSTENTLTLIFKNSNVNDGRNIAILIQYGHGTRNGGYVKGVDYINPALRPIFEKIRDELWAEVTNA